MFLGTGLPQRFLYVAASGNPSVLMSCGHPVLEAAPQGLELQGLGDLFVGHDATSQYLA